MHEHLTHNKTYPTCREFADAILNFLRDEVPRKWGGPLGADSDQAADLTVGRGLRSSNCCGLR